MYPVSRVEKNLGVEIQWVIRGEMLLKKKKALSLKHNKDAQIVIMCHN